MKSSSDVKADYNVIAIINTHTTVSMPSFRMQRGYKIVTTMRGNKIMIKNKHFNDTIYEKIENVYIENM